LQGNEQMSENTALFVRISRELKADLEREAKRQRRSLASLVEVLLAEQLSDKDRNAA